MIYTTNTAESTAYCCTSTSSSSSLSQANNGIHDTTSRYASLVRRFIDIRDSCPVTNQASDERHQEASCKHTNASRRMWYIHDIFNRHRLRCLLSSSSIIHHRGRCMGPGGKGMPGGPLCCGPPALRAALGAGPPYAAGFVTAICGCKP